MTLPQSITWLIEQITSTPPRSPRDATRLVAEAKINASDLLLWADFDHPVADSYGRKLVFDGGFFEIMVMSWNPGDFSAIHDHGHTVWGAVQVFGSAGHAIFASDGEQIVTVNRTRLTPERILGVGHDLVHQMGNPGNERFLSLHIYGNPDCQKNVTGDARIFDLLQEEIVKTDGGVFYGLPEKAVNSRTGLLQSDYYTWLHDATKKLQRAIRAKNDTAGLLKKIADESNWQRLKNDLKSRVDESGRVTDSRYWKWLKASLKEMSSIQGKLVDGKSDEPDARWRSSACEKRIGGPTQPDFPDYLHHIFQREDLAPSRATFLNVGDGTRRPGLLELNENFGQFDVTFCNRFQFLHPREFLGAVRRTQQVTKPGGICICEFVAGDHIRSYPNLIVSDNDRLISLRTPVLVQRDGWTIQESEVINIHRHNGIRIATKMIRRFVCTPRTAREAIESVFDARAYVLDTVTLDEIAEECETCDSTRYAVCIRRNL